MEIALEAGAEDVVTNDDSSIDIITASAEFIDIREALIKSGNNTEDAEITMRAATSITLDRDRAESMIRLLDMLEDLDDVQKVYSNADIPDEILEQLG
jgi:transcriptional/translational regulatory protein YebC/TACO1